MPKRDLLAPPLPSVAPMPKPPDSRIIPLDRQTPLTHQQIEQVRFGLGDTGPLAQAVMNSNGPALLQALPFGVTASSGMIVAFADKVPWTAPSGWLQCNGQSVAKAQYPQLYVIIGDTYGSTSSTFALPTISDIAATIKYVIKY